MKPIQISLDMVILNLPWSNKLKIPLKVLKQLLKDIFISKKMKFSKNVKNGLNMPRPEKLTTNLD